MKIPLYLFDKLYDTCRILVKYANSEEGYALCGSAGYQLGKWLCDYYTPEDKEEFCIKLMNQLYTAHYELEESLGRPPNVREIKELVKKKIPKEALSSYLKESADVSVRELVENTLFVGALKYILHPNNGRMQSTQ